MYIFLINIILLKSQSISSDGVFLCEALQSSNTRLLAGAIVEFHDVENVRIMIIETSNAEIGEFSIKNNINKLIMQICLI